MNTLFEAILREDKTARIKKLDIPDELKNKYITFFKAHSNLESKVNWNGKKDAVVSEIEALMTNTDSSRSKTKKKVRKNLRLAFQNIDKSNWPTLNESDFKIWYCDNSFIFVSPLCWEAAQYMNSFDLYGTGAKWCIGWETNDSHWAKYVVDQMNSFVFVYNADTKEKWMIQKEYQCDDRYELWNAEDQCVFNNWADLERVFTRIGFIEETDDEDFNVVHQPEFDMSMVNELISEINSDVDDEFDHVRECSDHNVWNSLSIGLENCKEKIWDLFFEDLEDIKHEYQGAGNYFKRVEHIKDEFNQEVSSAFDGDRYYRHQDEIDDFLDQNWYDMIKDLFEELKRDYMNTGVMKFPDEYMVALCGEHGLGKKQYEDARNHYYKYIKADWKNELEKRAGQQFLFESILKKKLTEVSNDKIKSSINKISLAGTKRPKEEYIKWFTNRRDVAKEVNWNLTNDFLLMDMEDAIKRHEEKSQAAKMSKVKEGDLAAMFKGRDDCEIIHKTENDIFVVPLAHSAAEFMNSFNCYGNGAKWCIGTKGDKRAWDQYVFDNKNVFIFVYNREANEKYMIQIRDMTGFDEMPLVSVFNEEDTNVIFGSIRDGELMSGQHYIAEERVFGSTFKNNFNKLAAKATEIFEEKVIGAQHKDMKVFVKKRFVERLKEEEGVFLHYYKEQLEDESQWRQLFDNVIYMGFLPDILNEWGKQSNNWITSSQFMKLSGLKRSSMEDELFFSFEAFIEYLNETGKIRFKENTVVKHFINRGKLND